MNIIDDVAQHLHNQSIGVLGTSLFKAYLPDVNSTAISVIDTGGISPDHNIPLKRYTFQIFIRSLTYNAGKTKLDAIYDALHAKRETRLTPSGNLYSYIYALSPGGHTGRDEEERDTFSINFQCEIK